MPCGLSAGMAAGRSICFSLGLLLYLLLFCAVELSEANTAPRIHGGRTLSAKPVLETVPLYRDIYKVSASDADSGKDGNITFSIFHHVSSTLPEYLYGAIDIHPITGMIFMNKSLDFDTFPIAKSAIFTPILYHQITVTDQGTPPLSARVYFALVLADSNDNAPQFINVPKNISVDDSSHVGSEVLRLADINVTDIDHGNNGQTVLSVVVQNVTAEENPFNITQTAVYLQRPLDLLDRSEYEFLLVAKDTPIWTREKVLTSTTTLSLLVTTKRFIEPVFVPNASQMVFLSEKLPVGSQVAHLVTEYFNPVTRNRQVVYHFSQGAAVLGNMSQLETFTIDTGTGIITLAEKLDFEQAERHRLEVVAMDPEDPMQNSTATITVFVLDENDNYPELMGEPGAIRFQVDSITEGEDLYTANCTDEDSGENSETVFVQIDSSNSSWLQITSNGTIIFNMSRDDIPDLGTELNTSIGYMCCDGGQPQLCSDIANFTLVLEPAATPSTMLMVTSPPTPSVTVTTPSTSLHTEIETSSNSQASTTQEGSKVVASSHINATSTASLITITHKPKPTSDSQNTTSNSLRTTSNGQGPSHRDSSSSLSKITTLPTQSTTSNREYTSLRQVTISSGQTTASNREYTSLRQVTTSPGQTTASNREYTSLRQVATSHEQTTAPEIDYTSFRQVTTSHGQTTASKRDYTSLREVTTSPAQTTTSNKENVSLRLITTLPEKKTTSNREYTSLGHNDTKLYEQPTTSNGQSNSPRQITTLPGKRATSDGHKPVTSPSQPPVDMSTASESSTLPLKAVSIITGAVVVPVVILILLKIAIICRRKRLKQGKRRISSITSFQNQSSGSISLSSRTVVITNNSCEDDLSRRSSSNSDIQLMTGRLGGRSFTMEMPPLSEDDLSRRSSSNSDIQLTTGRLGGRRVSKILDIDLSCSSSPPSSSSPTSEQSLPSDVEAQQRRDSMSLGSLGDRARVWRSSPPSTSSSRRAFSRTTSASMSSQFSRSVHTRESVRGMHFPPSLPKQGSQTYMAFLKRPHTAGGSMFVTMDGTALPNSTQPSDADHHKSTTLLNSLASSRDDLTRLATGSIADVCI